MAVGGMAKAFDLKNRTSSQSSKASRKGSGKYKTTKNQEAKMICVLCVSCVFYNLPGKGWIQIWGKPDVYDILSRKEEEPSEIVIFFCTSGGRDYERALHQCQSGS